MGIKGDKIIEKKSDMFGEQEIEIKGEEAGSKGNTFPLEHDYELRHLASQQAKKLDGSYAGFQPKPAVEIIIVAMKPISEKTYVDQAMKNGKGITWLDDCRIPFENKSSPGKRIFKDGKKTNSGFAGDNKKGEWESRTTKRPDYEENNQGRFPANLLVSDEILNDGYKGIKSVKKEVSNKGSIWGSGNEKKEIRGHNDFSGFSKYFNLDKWAKKTFPFLIVPKASKAEKNKGCKNRIPKAKCELDKLGGEKCGMKTGSGNERNVKYLNNHPTVKPIKLMSYLITLGSRQNDIVFDPFCGSGTTCISADILGRKFIGADKEQEYIEIAKARIEAETKQGKFNLI